MNTEYTYDASGDVDQFIQYMPLRQTQDIAYGELLVDQRSSGHDIRFPIAIGITGKERDEETGLDYFGARYYDSDLSVWLSVDPLADKYPSMSSYMYTAGNPVMLVDPDGMRIWVREKNGTGRKGHRRKLLYKNGKLYQRRRLFGRKEYTGGDEFANQVKDDLNSIKAGDEMGNHMVTTLENSRKNHYIENGVANGVRRTQKNKQTKRNANNGRGTSGTVVLTGQNGKLDNGDSPLISTPETSLAHELRHLYSLDRGSINTRILRVHDFSGGTAGLPLKELRAVRYENRVRSRLELPLRKAYRNEEGHTCRIPNPRAI